MAKKSKDFKKEEAFLEKKSIEIKSSENSSEISYLLGLDEAGRGPVLGPLVMAALVVDAEGEKKLKWLGVKDSKLLSSETREELFERIREIVLDFRVEVIEPDVIDLSLSDATTNLNWLEADTAARMVVELAQANKNKNPSPLVAVVDCPSPNIAGYTAYFLKKMDEFYSADFTPEARKKIDLRLEHKADANHIVVGAASIVAKVIRDRAIEHLKNEVGIDFGSGYMTDPKTKDFLEKYHQKYPHLFRKQWQSYKDAVVRKEQKKLGEF
ncbi:ribonuclease HII [Candidatus Woesearchaeota archaeon]|nr:ribonuclease HII [Candidatus Woesearchaeota archaeon]